MSRLVHERDKNQTLWGLLFAKLSSMDEIQGSSKIPWARSEPFSFPSPLVRGTDLRSAIFVAEEKPFSWRKKKGILERTMEEQFLYENFAYQ